MSRHASLVSDALVALRHNPLRSFLSILGLVIGVAALVAILALADGMERYARAEIGETTDIQNIGVMPRTVDRIDGVVVPRGTIVVPTPADAAALEGHLGGSAVVVLAQNRTEQVSLDTVQTAATLFAAGAAIWSFRDVEAESGRLFSAGDVEAARSVVVISAALAQRLGADSASVVGRRIHIGALEAEVIGVLPGDVRSAPEAYGPYPAFVADAERHPPRFYLRALRAEDVALVAERVEVWLDARYPEGSDAFVISTNEQRVGQVAQAMLLFKLIFGLITGISVLVGGVGVMNVLLVTVTERTREIGIRKAVGARRRDIGLQFLVEALTVAGVGSAIGLIVGLLGIFALMPIIRRITEVSFDPAITGQTLLVVSAVAVAVGVLFGTYPALRAARLSPVEAMRHE